MTVLSMLILILVAVIVLSLLLLLFKVFIGLVPLIIVAAVVIWVMNKLKREGREDEKIKETPFWQQTHEQSNHERKQAENFKVTFDNDDDKHDKTHDEKEQ